MLCHAGCSSASHRPTLLEAEGDAVDVVWVERGGVRLQGTEGGEGHSQLRQREGERGGEGGSGGWQGGTDGKGEEKANTCPCEQAESKPRKEHACCVLLLLVPEAVFGCVNKHSEPRRFLPPRHYGIPHFR